MRNCSLRAISPFPTVFKTFVLYTCKNYGLFGKGLTPFNTKRRNFTPVQIESVCIRQLESVSKIRICFEKGRNHCGKRRKCWLPAFSSFPTMFSKGFFRRVLKSRDCVVNS